MDITALSDDTFSAADWINANYKKCMSAEEEGGASAPPTEDDTAALAFINSYVSKLQLYVQQVNYAVKDTSQQLVASMPRIAKEARVLHSDVQQLQRRMLEMRQEVAAVQAETGDCMATLERLNTLQTRLQAAKESLQESDGWGNLIGELEDCFERNDLKSVCEKLVALQKSLQAQEQLPGHGDRQTQVEDFKNRLEALASPAVVQCFAAGNAEQALSYVRIFAGIGRLPQLQQYYRAVQKNTLQQQWKQTLELQATETAAQQQHFLTLYYDQLLEHCQRQVKWCAHVFAAEEAEVAAAGGEEQLQADGAGPVQPFLVVAELLPALQPSRDAHILQLLKSSNDRLELLQQYAQSNHAFVLHLNAFVAQSGFVLAAQTRLQLGAAIYEYFYKFIAQYPRLEETQLSTQVDRLILGIGQGQASASDSVRHLDDSSRKVFDWLTEACQRCAQITSDLALCKLIVLLGGIFKRVLENFAKTQRQLSLSLGGGGGGGHKYPNNGGGGGSQHTENWSMLQYTMTLLQCLADFQLKLNKFERTLHERMAALAEKLNAAAAAVSASTSSTTAISIFHTYERSEQKRLLAAIEDYQQRRAEASTSQVLSLGIFPHVYDSLRHHFSDTHDIALAILLQPIEAHLANILPSAEDAHSPVGVADMPAFSFAPQECITQIGQYLLTLPQHLEPLLLAPSPLLKQALESCNIKYTQSIPCADILLSLVVEQCCVLYQSQVLQIKSLPSSAAKQLAVDIEYLSSVVEELGLAINLHLGQILTLLKAAPEQYLTLSSGCEPRLVTAIRQMRNIISTQ